MTVSLGELAVVLTANNAKFNADVKQSAGLLGDFEAVAKKAAVAAGAIFVAGAAVSSKFIEAASDAAEQMNVLNIAFGDNTQSVVEWSQTTSQAIGRSATDLKDYAGQIGALVSPTLGVNDATRDMSTNLAQLAVDLGSVFNAAETDVLLALKAGLIGSTEPMQRFGVNMNVAALQAFALEKGITANVTKMSEAEKIALRYAFVMEKTAAFQGDAARTALGWANMTKRVEGQVTDLVAEIGAGLLPHAEKLIVAVSNIVGWFQQLSPETKAYIGLAVGAATAVAGLVAVVAGLGLAIPAMVTGLVAAATAMAPVILFAGVLALKIGVLITAVALLRKAWVDDLGGMRTVTVNFAKGVVGAWEVMTSSIARAWQGVSKFIVDTFDSVVESVSKLFDLFSDDAIRAIEIVNPAAALAIRGLKGLGTAAKTLVPDFEGMGSALVEVGSGISDAFDNASQEAGYAFEGLKGAATETASFVVDAFSELGADIADAIGFDTVQDLFQLDVGAAPFAAAGVPQIAAQGGAGKGKGKATTAAAGDTITTQVQALEQSLIDTGSSLVNSFGKMGDLIATTVEAGMKGGPYAAAAAALTKIATSTQAFAGLVSDLDKIFGMLVKMLEPLLEVVRVGLTPILEILRIALGGLTVAITAISIALGWVVNAMIDTAASFLEIVAGLADIFGAGGDVREFADDLRRSRVDIDSMVDGLEFAARGATDLGNSAFLAGDEIRDAFGITADAIGGIGSSLAEKLGELVESTDAQSIASGDAASSLNELNDAIANVPTGFKVAAARFEAVDVGDAGLTDASVGGSTFVIQANDARDVWDKIKEINREEQVFDGLSPADSRPNAVDRRGS
jgi:hypothetical protein